MGQTKHRRSALGLVALLMAGLLALPTAGLAQLGELLPSPTLPVPTPTASTVTGQASAAQVVLLGVLGTAISTSLASTGISATNSESDVSQVTGSIPSLLGADVLSAATYSYPDQVDSTASLANLGLTVAGISISADSVVAQASQVLGAAGSGNSYIDNLAINGVPVSVSGAPNQTISIPGGQVVLNEQTISSTGSAVVNAIHVTVNGVADVVVASATAGIS
jgi:hypothetical protein